MKKGASGRDESSQTPEFELELGLDCGNDPQGQQTKDNCKEAEMVP